MFLGSSDLGFSDQGSGCKGHAGCITGVCDVASGAEIVTYFKPSHATGLLEVVYDDQAHNNDLAMVVSHPTTATEWL
jgi:hypothetical protein